MKKRLRDKIEEYVDDWHWDEESKKYAFEMGEFLFSFINYIGDQNLSEKTKRNHRNNVYLIGLFESGYGYNEEFHPKNLEDGPGYLYEFERKVSDSKYALQAYISTWRILDKYIKSGEYKKYFLEVKEKIKKE